MLQSIGHHIFFYCVLIVVDCNNLSVVDVLFYELLHITTNRYIWADIELKPILQNFIWCRKTSLDTCFVRCLIAFVILYELVAKRFGYRIKDPSNLYCWRRWIG